MTQLSVTRDSHVIDPTVDQVRDVLRRVLGDLFEQTWSRACVAARVDPDADHADDVGFDRLLDSLAEQDPLSRVIATSWRIRRTAARKLAELGR